MPKYVITSGQLESAYILKSYAVPLTIIAKVLGVHANTLSWHLRRKSKTSPFANLPEIVRTLRETADRVEAVYAGKDSLRAAEFGLLQGALPAARTTLLPDIFPGETVSGPPARFQSNKAGASGATQREFFAP